MTRRNLISVVLFMFTIALGVSALWAAMAAGASGVSVRKELANQAYRLAVTIDGGVVSASVEDRIMDVIVAEGPVMYHTVKQVNGRPVTVEKLEEPTLTVDDRTLVIRGMANGLIIEHEFTLPAQRDIMEERIVVKNDTGTPEAYTEFEVGLTRQVADKAGRILPSLAGDRVVAVPFRYRAPGHGAPANADSYFDYSLGELVTTPGQTYHINKSQAPIYRPSRHRCSEGWAWTHGDYTLGIFSFNQEEMVFSVISTLVGKAGKALRFGGAAMIEGEPAALSRIAPGQSVDMGLIRYQTIKGGYSDAMYAYREMLDEKGCRFPKDYNPPVHWEQLYDMRGAWHDRQNKYTKAIIDQQAAMGRDFSCEALYLDPGWDTDFGTFLWGEKWLGPRKPFVEEMLSKYGLKVSLHCPLASWVSHRLSWGFDAVSTYPESSWRQSPPEDQALKRVPALRKGHRNLALLPTAKPNALSVRDGGSYPLCQIADLNDGSYGNDVSWMAEQQPAWAEIDLGAVYEIAQVVLGNGEHPERKHRASKEVNVLVATEYKADGKALTWSKVAEYRGVGLGLEGPEVLAFQPIQARWVRVELLNTGKLPPRLGEIEIYEAKPVGPVEAAVFEKKAKRGARSLLAADPLICLGSKQYLDEAEKRLLANCADGVTFLMFDGNWWNGGCSAADHGHPVPYLGEDHIRANVELAKRIHAKYPNVLIEMHDMLAGGSRIRRTPIYYKYGLPGSYDENWGFELMWNILQDVKSGRAKMLCYANMGCNVPIYLHINLSQDNEHLLGLWWYASTCRHLGIGGTHRDPKIVAAQQEAMKYYRTFERFFKRGEFYAIGEEIHLHVVPQEKAFMANVFNLSDQKKIVSGSFDLRKAGLTGTGVYRSSKNWARVEDGVFRVSLEMPPWSAEVVDIHRE